MSSAPITPTEIGSLRSRLHELSAQDHRPAVAEELIAIADRLLDLVEQVHSSEMQLRALQAELVAACRASVAAARLGEPHPLVHVEHQLTAHGWMPGPDWRPARLLAAVTELRDLLRAA
jgi:hypothetical protein